MEKKRLEIISFIVLCTGVLLLTFLIFRPFMDIIVLGIVLALLFKPLYKKMLNKYPGGKSLFAFIIVLIALIFLIIPILFFGFEILSQIQMFFTLLQNGQSQNIQHIQSVIELFARHFVPDFSLNVPYYASVVLSFISNNIGALLSQTAYIFFQIFFLSFALFFFLRDGESLFNSLVGLSPFSKEQSREITDSVRKVVTSVVRGTLFVGLVRWVLFTAAFYFFNIPNAMIWGSLSAVIGALPGLGTPFVLVPAVIYLVLSGSIFSAIGVGLFGILIMFFVDNVLSAYFFGKGLEAPPIFILFSILGGVLFFGPIGFIFGPIILSLFISAIEMYKILILKNSN